MRVLLVEDDALQRRLLALRLRGAGLMVEETADGLTACAKLEADPPDALLLDLELPGLNGLALLERQRTEGRPLPPTVVLSARDDAAEREQALALGALDLLAKPPRLDRLLALIGAPAPTEAAR